MNTFAHLLRHKWFAWTIIAFTLIFAITSVGLSTKVVQDDDLLAFLPEGNEDIRAFRDINERFGGMDVALVGIETSNPFDGAFLQQLKQVTDDLNAHPHIDYALSLANVDDYAPDPMGGVKQGPLLIDIPDTIDAQATFRTRVMSKDHLVGNVISADGNGLLIYAFAAFQDTDETVSSDAEQKTIDARTFAATVRTIVREGFPESDTSATLYWGGAPFISSYIFDACQADLRWLSPLSVLVIIVIILISFRDWVGSALALVSTLIGVVSSQAAMVLCGISYNIVLSGMPVILFAVGSAYSIHMLSRYYANARTLDTEAALHRTLTETGPIVVAAGLTTVAGLGSFVVMDIAPMRIFGVFTAFGILVTLVLSVFFVPAVIRLVGLKSRTPETGSLNRTLLHWAERVQQHRTTGMIALAILLFLGGMLVGRVDSRVDQSAFFSQGSKPAEAQAFLDSRFGGSQFLQVHFKGAVGDAAVLREIRHIADQIRVLPDVSDVIHIGEIVALINDAMDGDKRIPDDSEQAATLLRLLTGNRSVGQVITEDRTEALLHVKIGANTVDALDRVLEQVNAILSKAPRPYYLVQSKAQGGTSGTTQQQTQTLDRILAVMKEYGATTQALDQKELLARIQKRPTAIPAEGVRNTLVQWLQSDECWTPLTPAQANRAADAWVSLGPETTEEQVTDILTSGLSEFFSEEELTMTVDDLMLAAQPQVDDMWRRIRSEVHRDTLLSGLKILPPEGDRGQRFRAAVAGTLMDLDVDEILIHTTEDDVEQATLSAAITGLPQLYQGLSNSISNNQIKSLVLALGLVLVIMTFMFRSFTAGLVATSPTLFTLLVVYGAMGLMEVHLDIGTSMLASLIIGAGVDYSVHLMAAWDGATTKEALQHSVAETAPAIWTNAFMVAAGFFVLSLGEAKPLQNVGLLTAAAMLAAAIGTFLVIPVFARRTRYRRLKP